MAAKKSATTKKPPKTSAVDDLVAILDLERLEQNLFRGRGPKAGWQRVYGGQVLGQALVAAQANGSKLPASGFEVR